MRLAAILEKEKQKNKITDSPQSCQVSISHTCWDAFRASLFVPIRSSGRRNKPFPIILISRTKGLCAGDLTRHGVSILCWPEVYLMAQNSCSGCSSLCRCASGTARDWRVTELLCVSGAAPGAAAPAAWPGQPELPMGTHRICLKKLLQLKATF